MTTKQYDKSCCLWGNGANSSATMAISRYGRFGYAYNNADEAPRDLLVADVKRQGLTGMSLTPSRVSRAARTAGPEAAPRPRRHTVCREGATR